MARAKICDRCGGVYGTNNHTASFGPGKHGIVRGVCVMLDAIDIDDPTKNAYMDLCDDCGKMLTTFLRDEGNVKVRE